MMRILDAGSWLVLGIIASVYFWLHIFGVTDVIPVSLILLATANYFRELASRRWNRKNATRN